MSDDTTADAHDEPSIEGAIESVRSVGHPVAISQTRLNEWVVIILRTEVPFPDRPYSSHCVWYMRGWQLLDGNYDLTLAEARADLLARSAYRSNSQPKAFDEN